jgi:hypothetical protein
MDAWQYFDPEQYSDEIISRMELADGRLVVPAERLVPIVRRLHNFMHLILNCFSSTVDDLGFLAGLPHVEVVGALCTGSVDLAPLAEHSDLVSVLLYNADRYTNIRALRHLPKLRILHLYSLGKWRSIAFARHFPMLEALSLIGLNKVTDYSALSSLKRLRFLHLGDCGKLASLDPIRHLHELRELTLRGCDIPDLAAGLAEAFPLLEDLDIDHASVSDLAPLVALPLESLSVIGCPAKDVSPLSEVDTLRELWLSRGGEYNGLDRLSPKVRIDYA